MTKTTDTVKLAELEAKITPEVAELAKVLGASTTVDPTTGLSTLTADNYEKALTAVGLSAEIATKVQDFNVTYALAAGTALGHAALPVMKDNKDLKRASLTAHTLGKDVITATFDRSRPKPGQKEGEEPQLSYGSLSIDMSFYGGKNGVALRSVKQFFSAAATEAFID
jgi:hypothetical protein